MIQNVFNNVGVAQFAPYLQHDELYLFTKNTADYRPNCVIYNKLHYIYQWFV